MVILSNVYWLTNPLTSSLEKKCYECNSSQAGSVTHTLETVRLMAVATESKMTGSAKLTTTFKTRSKDDIIPSQYQPYQGISYSIEGQNDDRSVFVVPRRVYFDDRVHRGKLRNVLVILAEIHDEAYNTVKACEINGFYTHNVSVHREDAGWVRNNRPGYTHRGLLVECRGLPLKAIINGSFPQLIYKKKGDDYYSFVKSEKPLVLKKFSSIPARGKGSVVVCTTLFGHPPMFNHWLKYQKTIGVDSVQLNTDPTFIHNAATLYPFLNESLNNGFVQVDVWEKIVGNRIFHYGQTMKYQDCIYRHINMFEYVLVYDADDYFNPLIPHQNNIHYYLDKYFSKNTTASVHMAWRDMKCRPVPKKLETLQDGNLTSILGGYYYKKRNEWKCVYRVNAVVMLLVHYEQIKLPGYISIASTDALSYVAHNRDNNKLC